MDIAGPLRFLSVVVPLSVSKKGPGYVSGKGQVRGWQQAQGFRAPASGWLAQGLVAPGKGRERGHVPLLTPGLRMLPRPRPGTQTESTASEVHATAIAEARRPK